MSEIKSALLRASHLLEEESHRILDKQLSIVIAVYDSLNYTKDCLNSLQEHAPNAEVIVVNNGSQKETKEYLNSLPHIKVIHWDENRGVSKAWNAGMKLATRNVLCVLNNDVLVYPGGMQRLVQATLDTGIAGNEGACMNMDFCYAYSTDNADEADYLGGYCIVFTREIWEKVGVFDELFSPAYWEDNDWGLRAKLAGYKWQIIPGCVYHYVARTSVRVLDVGTLFAAQRIKFINKWGPVANGLGERILVLREDATAEEAQKCIDDLRLKKPLSKIQLLSENDFKFINCDCIDTERKFKEYTQVLNCKEYLQKPLFSFITWVNNEIQYRNLLKSSHHIKIEYVCLGQEYESMSKAYNAGTELANGEYLVYVHQDVEILDSFFEQKIINVLKNRNDIGFIGVIGSLTNHHAKSVWFYEGAYNCRGFAIQKRYEAVNISVYNGPASLIDGLIMITDKKFNFPESLPHVHFVDAWMCNVANEHGYINWIADILVNHDSGGETQSEHFKNNLVRYRLKWFTNDIWNNNMDFNDIKSMLSNIVENTSHKSGIAITTRNRPEMLRACLMHFKAYTNKEALKHLIIYDDSSDYELRLKNQEIVKQYGMSDRYYVGKTQVGVAQAKNCCMYILGNTYDYYFLFDDDTFPIKKGWIELYIKARQQSGFHHLLYGNDTHCTITGKNDGIEFYSQGFGVLLFFTKEMYEKLGGFCTSYGIYGIEHVDFTLRAHKAGMTNLLQAYAGPEGCLNYIWNADTKTPQQKTLIEVSMDEESIPRADKNENAKLAVQYDLNIHQNRPIYYPININHEILRIT